MAVPLFLEFSGKAECRATFQFSRLFTRASTNGKYWFVAEKKLKKKKKKPFYVIIGYN
jgi:hypothetical protein